MSYINLNGEFVSKPRKLKLSDGTTLLGDIPDDICKEHGFYLFVEPTIGVGEKTGSIVYNADGTATYEVLPKTAAELQADAAAEDARAIRAIDRSMVANTDALLECLINKGVITGAEPELTDLMAKKAQKDALKGK